MTGPPASVLFRPLAPVISATARNRVPATTGPPAPVTAGPLDSATSAMATGLSISVGSAVPIVATSLFYTILRGLYFNRTGLGKGPIEFIARGHMRGRLFP